MSLQSFLSPESLLVAAVLAPGVVFLLLAFSWILGYLPAERLVARVANTTFSFCLLALAGMMFGMWQTGATSVSAGSGNWLEVHEFRIPLALFVDRLSLPLVVLTVVLVGTVAVFSRRFLHLDTGFHRFLIVMKIFDL